MVKKKKLKKYLLLTTNLIESRKRWWNWVCWNLSSGLSALYTIPHEPQVVAPNCFWPASYTQEIDFQTIAEKNEGGSDLCQRTMTSWSSSCLSFGLRASRSLAEEDCNDAAGPEGVLQDKGDCRALLNLWGTKKKKKEGMNKKRGGNTRRCWTEVYSNIAAAKQTFAKHYSIYIS